MGKDNRDWYRDWWRKKTGYAERARFRMSEADYQKARRWSCIRPFAAAAVVALIVVIFLKIK